MSEVLILLLGQTPGDPVRWAFLADGNLRIADIAESADALTDIAARAAAARMVAAVLPGEQAAMRAMAAPPRTASKFRAAAAYLLEDELAEGLESLHVAVERREGGAGLALAVKKTVMEAWRDAFAAAGVSPDIITADFALLRLNAGRAAFVIEPGRIFGVAGLQGFAAERPMADALAVQLLSRDAIEDVDAYGDSDAEKELFAGISPEWRGMSDDVTLFHLFDERMRAGGVPNFRQGEFRKRREWRGVAGAWRRAAILAAACLIGFVGLVVADGARSARLANRLNEEAAALHLAAFPDQANANPRDHARGVLAAQSERPAFLPLATQFAESLEENGQIQVDRIRYNAARNEFSINLRFSDINDLEDLKRLLASRGVDAAEAGGVRRSGGFYVGELKVSQS